MPFNLNCKRGSTIFEDEEHLFIVKIQLLDNSLFDCAIPPECLGRDCLERVAKSLDLKETQYFGLSYLCKKNRQCWIELDKNLKKQLDRNALSGSKDEVVYFRVRFYIPSVLSLEQEVTRYLYYLQLRTDVIDGKMCCGENVAVLLASYALQAEFGDYDEEDLKTEDVAKEYVLLPKNYSSAADLNDKITHLHKEHRGMSTQAAELAYIIEAQQLEGYGEETYHTKDKDGNPIFIGASSIGLFVKHPQGLPTVYFKWPDVIHMGYHKKYFSVESAKCQDTVQFCMEDAQSARYVWKMFVAQHKFFKHYKFDPSQTALRRLSQLGDTPVTRRATLPRTPESLRKLVSDEEAVDGRETDVSGLVNTAFDMTEEETRGFAITNTCKTTGLPTSSASIGDNSREVSVEKLLSHAGETKEFGDRQEAINLSSSIENLKEVEQLKEGSSERKISVNSVDRYPLTRHHPVHRRISLDSHIADATQKKNLYRTSVEELHPKHGRLRMNSTDSDDGGNFGLQSQSGLVKMSTFGNLAEMEEFFDNSKRVDLLTSPDSPLDDVTERFEDVDLCDGPGEQASADSPSLNEDQENEFQKTDDALRSSLKDDNLDEKMSLEKELVDEAVLDVIPKNVTRDSGKDNSSDITGATSGYSTSNSESGGSSPARSPAKTNPPSPQQIIPSPSHQTKQDLQLTTNDKPHAGPKDSQLEYLEQHLSQSSLYGEFENIPVKKMDCILTSATLPNHKEFNRYEEVLPYEDTRVKLHPSHNMYRSDYINANHVHMTVGKAKHKYIAAQAPMEKTCASFWQMIWEQKVAVVVMLADQKETGNGKIVTYWPNDEQGSAVKFGEYKISHMFCNRSDIYCVRGFNLKWNRSKETRRVFHLQFLVWPDNSVPHNPADLLALLEEMDSFQRQSKHRGGNSPVLVHCTAGVGRTGVLILTHLMLACLKSGQPVDIPRTLEHLRTQRMCLVQTLRQYRFVYMALIHYLHCSRLI